MSGGTKFCCSRRAYRAVNAWPNGPRYNGTRTRIIPRNLPGTSGSDFDIKSLLLASAAFLHCRMRVHLLFSLVACSFIHTVRSACTPVAPGGSSTSAFWMGDAALHANGKSAFNPGFKVFRNVKDYGAVGDGNADDTAAINKAISDGNSCGSGCPSSSIKPVLVYFPAGTYKVTAPIIPYYFTSLVGDYNHKPTLLAAPNFLGIAVIDADPYYPGEQNPDGSGVNWWTNQNNFFRSIRNFAIDVTAVPPNLYGTGIHWQVGQATSLINLDFSMSTAPGNNHQGIYGENGSGGFMSDLTFDGGAFGMWLSSQQFTIRNVKISRAVSAIYQWWDWGFTWQNIEIAGCQVGFDIHTGGLTLGDQSAGAVLIVDSFVVETPIAIRLSTSQPKSLGGSIALDNVAFNNIATATIQDSSGVVVPGQSGSYTIDKWFQGNTYFGAAPTYTRGTYDTLIKRSSILEDDTGSYFTKSRPQYNTYLSSQFLSVVSVGGAKGDGVTDDSAAINNFISQHAGCGILFFDAGTYLVKDTIFVPPGTIIVGEMFSTIVGAGSKFASQSSPTPVLRVGNSGDTGPVEISDMVITTQGGSQGAIGIEWNVNGTSPGAAGLWDVHIRLGGTIGTNVNSANCPTSSQNLVTCATAFLGFHITKTGSGYFENLWVWNADHDLDDPEQTQINAYSGRGILVESSSGPNWLWGTASEHHVIYQYAFYNTENVFAGLIQTETPYYQPTPNPPAPFSTSLLYGDPPGDRQDAWGLVITSSFNVFIYGAGLYSFFQTYGQTCVPNNNCQDSIALIDDTSAAVQIFQLTTVATVNMLTGAPNFTVIKASDNINGFASTATYWESTGAGVLPPYNGQIPPKDCSSPPKVVGYYLSGAGTRSCLPWAPNATDSSTFTHIIYGYAAVAADGTVSLTDTQVAEMAGIQSMQLQEPGLTVMIGVGGWGFGADPTNFIAMAQSSGTQVNFASSIAQVINHM
ncbi:pectate lyase superfamily protein-domain-containing protein [Mycena haematopus]|nr:pectate lyase superfamily protein-domain-containing protein [Mycena haematopus]